MKQMQFSLRILLIAVALTGWVVLVFLPGGVYVTLPIGIGVLLLASSLIAARGLLASRRDCRRNTRLQLQLLASVLLLLTLLVVFPPIWSLAASRRDHVVFVSTQRDYVLGRLPAELVRDDGRMLLRRMNANGDKTLFSTSAFVPGSISNLDPRYVESRGDYLLVALGKKADRFDLLIYADGVEGRGTNRLEPGIWFFQSGPGRWITDTDWDAGIRN